MIGRPTSERLEISDVHGTETTHIYYDRYFHGAIHHSHAEAWQAWMHVVDLGYFPSKEAAKQAVRDWFAGLDIEP